VQAHACHAEMLSIKHEYLHADSQGKQSSQSRGYSDPQTAHMKTESTMALNVQGKQPSQDRWCPSSKCAEQAALAKQKGTPDWNVAQGK